MMKIMKTLTQLLLFCFIALATSCAGVKVYSDSKLTKDSRTGIKVHYPKPYLLVSYHRVAKLKKNPKGDQLMASDSASAEIVWLPDLENPQYIKTVSGLGASELELSMTNGILTSYGLNTDTKIPETIGAISALVGLGGGSEEAAEESEDKTTEGVSGLSLSDSAKTITSDVDELKKLLDNRKSYRLFEIKMAGGKTTLSEVKFPN